MAICDPNCAILPPSPLGTGCTLPDQRGGGISRLVLASCDIVFDDMNNLEEWCEYIRQGKIVASSELLGEKAAATATRKKISSCRPDAVTGFDYTITFQDYNADDVDFKDFDFWNTIQQYSSMYQLGYITCDGLFYGFIDNWTPEVSQVIENDANGSSYWNGTLGWKGKGEVKPLKINGLINLIAGNGCDSIVPTTGTSNPYIVPINQVIDIYKGTYGPTVANTNYIGFQILRSCPDCYFRIYNPAAVTTYPYTVIPGEFIQAPDGNPVNFAAAIANFYNNVFYGGTGTTGINCSVYGNGTQLMFSFPDSALMTYFGYAGLPDLTDPLQMICAELICINVPDNLQSTTSVQLGLGTIVAGSSCETEVAPITPQVKTDGDGFVETVCMTNITLFNNFVGQIMSCIQTAPKYIDPTPSIAELYTYLNTNCAAKFIGVTDPMIQYNPFGTYGDKSLDSFAKVRRTMRGEWQFELRLYSPKCGIRDVSFVYNPLGIVLHSNHSKQCLDETSVNLFITQFIAGMLSYNATSISNLLDEYTHLTSILSNSNYDYIGVSTIAPVSYGGQTMQEYMEMDVFPCVDGTNNLVIHHIYGQCGNYGFVYKQQISGPPYTVHTPIGGYQDIGGWITYGYDAGRTINYLANDYWLKDTSNDLIIDVEVDNVSCLAGNLAEIYIITGAGNNITTATPIAGATFVTQVFGSPSGYALCQYQLTEAYLLAQLAGQVVATQDVEFPNAQVFITNDCGKTYVFTMRLYLSF